MIGKIDATNARIDVTNEKLGELSKANGIGNKLNAIIWVIGGSITLGTFLITVGKAFGWF